MEKQTIVYGFGWPGAQFRNLVLLNRNLKRESKIKEFILKHELEHANTKGFWKNFFLDFKLFFNWQFIKMSIYLNFKYPETVLPFFVFRTGIDSHEIVIVLPWLLAYTVFFILLFG